MKRILLAAFVLFAVTLAGCGSSNSDIGISGQQGNIGNNNPNPNPNPGGPPVAVDDANFAINATGTLTVPDPGVLANDTLNGGAITNFPTTTARGGNVQLNPGGGFTYTAPATTGADSFQYSLTNANGTSTATVNIQVVGNAVFVNNQAAPGGNGSFAAPFSTIGAAVAAATGANNTIFVFRGSGNPYNEAITLQNGQRLIGEGAGLAVLGRAEGETLGQVQPNFPVLSGPITMANDNTVQGVRIQGSANDAITSNGVNGTITGNQFDSNGQDAVMLSTASGNWTITNNTITSQPRFLNISGALASGNATYVITGNTMTNVQAALFLGASGTSNVRAQVVNNSIAGATLFDSFSFVVLDTATVCVDITGNATNQQYAFQNGTNSTLNVEQFSQITTLNSGTLAPTNGTVTDVANGFCGF